MLTLATIDFSGSGWKMGEVVGAQQSHFFSGHKNKQHGPARRLREAGIGPRDFQQGGGAGGVVEGAVTNVVAIHCRADSEMIHMRGVDHILVAQSADRSLSVRQQCSEL